MAKELPYFKFEPGGWDNGKIQMCSFEAQGVFINVCSMYWQRLGDLPYKLAIQKICKGNAVALQSLCDEGILKVIDGMICIDFLNEQLLEFENTSKTNSKNAREGWEKRRNNATALRPESDPNAIRGEKIRGDERKVIAPDVYESKENAFTEIRDNDQFIEECQRTLSGRGWMAVTPVDVIACLKQFINGKADITTPKDNVRQHFKNWLIREKIENLITYSEVFKKNATNGRAERRQA